MAVPPAVTPRRRHPAPRWAPHGRPLSAQQADARHRLVCALALLHLPALLLAAVLTGDLTPAGWLLPGLALLAAAAGPFQQRPRALAATGALLCSSAALVGVFPEHPELQAHLLVVVALVALYQDWTVFALAVVAGVVLSPVLGGLVLVQAAVLGVFWRADEQARAGEEQLQAALWEGQASIRSRLEETERIRTDLIGTVSHEFRTPLTGIRGAALTLLKRGDRLDEGARRQLLQGLIEQQERLSRLLENMLTAARATAADPAAVAEVQAVATEVVMLAAAARPRSPEISLVVEPGTTARIDRAALHQVLANLVDNAQLHGESGAVPLVAGGRDGDEVWVTVSNEGGPLDAQAARYLFEPFTQADAGPTRAHEGLGMGLYVVRRLVEVYGGWVNVRAESGWVTVEVRLSAGPQEPTAEPTRNVTPAAAAPSSS